MTSELVLVENYCECHLFKFEQVNKVYVRDN
jgi:hypothetical protein